MEISSVRWLSELGMDDHTFIHQCQMNSLDEFGSHQIAAALEDDFQYTFSSESFSSYPTFNPGNSTTTFSNSSMEASQTVTERPTKQLKTNSWNSCTTDHISTTHEASSSPNMLSFGNSTNSPTNHPQHLFGNPVGIVKPKDEAVSLGSMIFPSPVLISHDSYGSQNYVTKAGQGIKTVPASRPASTTQDHIIAERKRREKLSQSFIALSAIVPGLKKMDKASVLGDAIKYLKQLQERVKTLEEQAAKKTVESVVFVKKSQISTDDDNSSSDENLGGHPDEPLPEIEARVSEKNVLIRIHCENQKGVVKKTLAEIEKLHLTLVNSSVIPFGNSVLDITIVAQMDVDFSMTVKDLVRHLRSAFRHFVCEDKE